MGVLDTIFSSIADLVGVSASPTSDSTRPEKIQKIINSQTSLDPAPTENDPYIIKPENWYKNIPYAFRIVARYKPNTVAAPGYAKQDGGVSRFYFPVTPESLNISTPYAVSVTPTLGGIVQQHSGPVLYNITVGGSTGILPDLSYLTGTYIGNGSSIGRPSKQIGFLNTLLGATGFATNTLAVVNNIATTILGSSNRLAQASSSEFSGYTAYHFLYQFLWLYHKQKSGGSPMQLVFVNYKDNNQYDVAVTNFSLTRDRSAPHLYRFSVQMRGWALTSAGGEPPKFDAQARLDALGMNEGPSFKATAYRVINSTKSVLNSASGLTSAITQDAAF